MATVSISVGSMKNFHTYDTDSFDKSASFPHPVEVLSAPVDADDAVRLDDISDLYGATLVRTLPAESTVSIGHVLYVTSAGKWDLADADDADKFGIALAVDKNGSTVKGAILTVATVRVDENTATPMSKLFLSSTAGKATVTPTGTVRQQIGVALGSAASGWVVALFSPMLPFKGLP